MANELKRQQGASQLLFADHLTDFGAAPTTAANSLIIGTPVDVQLDLTGVAASGGARQSAKTASLYAGTGTDEIDIYYRVDACLEFAVAPTDADEVAFYWASSPASAAATGNPAGLTGADAAFTDTPGLLNQMQFIGSLSLRNNVLNIGHVGYFIPEFEYGMLVVLNNADQALNSAGNMDETHIVATPYTLGPTE